MHRMADEVQQSIGIPLLHIADATAEQIKAQQLGKIGLLGTGFAMEEDFYKGRLVERHGLEIIIPSQNDRELAHRVIYDELVVGEIRPTSKVQFIEIIDNLVQGGAEGSYWGVQRSVCWLGRMAFRFGYSTRHSSTPRLPLNTRWASMRPKGDATAMAETNPS